MNTTHIKEYRINEVCESIVDCVNKTAKHVHFETPFKMVRTTNIKSGWINLDEVRFVTEDVFKKWTRRITPQIGDIILTREAPLGEVGLVRTNDRIFLGQRTILYRADGKIADNRFLYYHFLSDLVQSQFSSFGSGSTVEHIRIEDCETFKVFLPALPAQRLIGSILGAYDDLIEVNNNRIRVLERGARELYKEWFVRMRFPGHKKAKFTKWIPNGWTFDACYSFSDVKGGGTPSTANPTFWNGNIKFFTPTDHIDSFFVTSTEKTITEKGLNTSSTKLFPKYSTFITARGSVGNICLAAEEMAMNQSCFGFTPKINDDRFYLFLFVDEMVNYLKLVATGATFDAITLNTFKNYKRSIASKDLRKAFSEEVTPIFFLIENLIHQNNGLRQIRDRLLPRLISGKLQIKNHELELQE